MSATAAAAPTPSATAAAASPKHKIKIQYCRPCGLKEYGQNLEQVIRYMLPLAPLEFEYEPKDEEQDKGMLVVSLGATVLYSKKDQGQLKTQAQLEEVVRRLTDAMQVAHSL